MTADHWRRKYNLAKERADHYAAQLAECTQRAQHTIMYLRLCVLACAILLAGLLALLLM